MVDAAYERWWFLSGSNYTLLLSLGTLWLSHMEAPVYFNIFWGCRILNAGDIDYEQSLFFL